MTRRHALRDDQWDKIKDALPGKEGDKGRTAADNRLFIDAVMWIAKTGAPWRDLPEYYGENGQLCTKGSSVGQRMVYGR